MTLDAALIANQLISAQLFFALCPTALENHGSREKDNAVSSVQLAETKIPESAMATTMNPAEVVSTLVLIATPKFHQPKGRLGRSL